MYLRAFVFLLLNKTNSKIHDMMDIKTANEIRVVDNFVFKMKLITVELFYTEVFRSSMNNLLKNVDQSF